MTETVLLMLALPAASILVAALAVAIVEVVEFASLMLFLLLVTSGRKAGRP
jgi:hypothetical protein